MTFRDIYENSPELFDMGLLDMSTENKERVLKHICLHADANKPLFHLGETKPVDVVTMTKRIVGNVLALLEHKQFALTTQLNLIKNLVIMHTSEQQSYSTDSLNDEITDGYTPLKNIASQNFTRMGLSMQDQYKEAWKIIELELSPIYSYLYSCIMFDHIDRGTLR